ncbi:hypothetical protein GCM10010246_02770 [Streptomyces cuspidosporus]|uniref:Uncharacterized protein n=1 Tax=Streptomyces cuspidosporus TaxID=66882 RepID=A0ABP5S9M0_9ACTN
MARDAPDTGGGVARAAGGRRPLDAAPTGACHATRELVDALLYADASGDVAGGSDADG